MSTTRDEILREAEREAASAGYRLAQGEDLDRLLNGLVANTCRYGYAICPCRIGSGDIVADRDIICPCDYRDADVKQYGRCY
ncbi:MAG: ferredoxin-thioredoxin reductase catalytic domain-containing protein [Planctomycetota bacterium]|nr:ferredoxin-thioredoxin reductase catalytic domain-containing protein [Planctomycetota bacterium]